MSVGSVVSIHIAKVGAAPMISVPEVQAIAGKGLEGDRYFDGTGTFSLKVDPAHEITLIEAEAIEAIQMEAGLQVAAIQSRRNVVTQNVPLNHLVGREFTVGKVILRGIRLCEPCGHMEKLAGKQGIRSALVHRGGLRAQILSSGVIRVGDPVFHSSPAAKSADAQLSQPESVSVSTPAVKLDDRPSDVTQIETMEFCLVPRGRFVLGSQDDAMAWDGESPSQVYDISHDYWISRFPVSNSQFHAFVIAGGYQARDYWLEAEQAGCWKDGLFRNPGADNPSTGPEDFGEPFNILTHPAGGITWYEALAFSRWMTTELQQSQALPPGFGVHLPSEVEWEKAARGGLEIPGSPRIARAIALPKCDSLLLQKNPFPHRRYSWGDQPDPTKANYLDSGLCATSPLGNYSGGASPYGTEDLCGNVWEWTRSLWGSYPYPSNAEDRTKREDLREAGMRTLRGGAFNYNDSLVRCSVRHHHSPLTAYRHIGFRVVASSLQA